VNEVNKIKGGRLLRYSTKSPVLIVLNTKYKRRPLTITFSAVIAFFFNRLPLNLIPNTYSANAIWPFVLRFIIGSNQHFHDDTYSEELYTCEYKH